VNEVYEPGVWVELLRVLAVFAAVAASIGLVVFVVVRLRRALRVYRRYRLRGGRAVPVNWRLIRAAGFTVFLGLVAVAFAGTAPIHLQAVADATRFRIASDEVAEVQIEVNRYVLDLHRPDTQAEPLLGTVSVTDPEEIRQLVRAIRETDRSGVMRTGFPPTRTYRVRFRRHGENEWQPETVKLATDRIHDPTRFEVSFHRYSHYDHRHRSPGLAAWVTRHTAHLERDR
jgi:hypothetical protein